MFNQVPFPFTVENRYTKAMVRLFFTAWILLGFATVGWAQIPDFGAPRNNPTQAASAPSPYFSNTNMGYQSPYYAQSPQYSRDPHLAQSRMSPGMAANTQGSYPRMGNLMGLGASLLQVFTGKGSFGDKLQFLLLDKVNSYVAQPIYQQADQAMSLENLYALANRATTPQGYTQNQAQCFDCVQPGPNGWMPDGGTNAHSMNEAFTSFSAVGGGSSSAPRSSGSGGAGVVSALP